MGLLQNWTDWQENFGAAVESWETQLQTKVTQMICGLYNSKAGAFFLTPFHKGYLRNKCSRVGMPPPPEPVIDPNAGQCVCVDYDVIALYQSLDGSREDAINSVRILGRFIEMTGTVAFDDGDSYLVDDKVVFATCAGGVETGGTSSKVLGRSIYKRSDPSADFTFREVDFVRVDGQPDNCAPPVVLTEEERTQNIFINNYDENNTIVSTSEYVVTLAEETNISVPISLDISGVSISFGTEGLYDNDSSDSGDGDDTSDDKSGDGNPENDSGDIITYNTENKITIKNYRPPSADKYDTEDTEDVDEKEEVEEAGVIAYVLVEVSVLPRGGRQILFPDEEDNTYFAGYISWIDVVDGISYRRPEEPIRKKYNSFPVPLTASGYRVYSVNGAKLKVTTYKEPPIVEEGA